jgi:hypothetical protein
MMTIMFMIMIIMMTIMIMIMIIMMTIMIMIMMTTVAVAVFGRRLGESPPGRRPSPWQGAPPRAVSGPIGRQPPPGGREEESHRSGYRMPTLVGTDMPTLMGTGGHGSTKGDARRT